MIPAPFDYHRPGTLDEAIGLLVRYEDDAKVLAGGMSLLPTLKLRLGSFGHLVDISRIAALEYVKEEKGVVRIGAGTRQCHARALGTHQVEDIGVLADALPLIADPLVRNRGTIGGNIANGDPSNDHPAIAIALGAELVARGPNGRAHHSREPLLQGSFRHRSRAPTRSWPRSASRCRRRAAAAPTASSSARPATTPLPRWRSSSA